MLMRSRPNLVPLPTQRRKQDPKQRKHKTLHLIPIQRLISLLSHLFQSPPSIPTPSSLFTPFVPIVLASSVLLNSQFNPVYSLSLPSLYLSLIPPSSFSEVNPNAFLTHPLRHIPLISINFNHGMYIHTHNLYNIQYIVLYPMVSI